MNAKRIPPTKTHAEMVSAWMGQPEFKAEYKKLDGEFALLDELLAARKKSRPHPSASR
ncbi:hypothetical protein [Sodalis ligni]|uniref:hypothetical protein n=1 Tax=Sodalis ligni TaxID=2697027 RepID=UPI002097356D|nr:hypothetical protein [Sodalis ligni]